MEMGSKTDWVCFVDSGVISLVSEFSDGSMAEITTIGREGFVNVGSLLDDDLAIARHVAQLSGEGRSMPTGSLQALIADSTDARNVFYRYAQALIAQLSQSVACNSVHNVEERLARWLLMMHDRVDGDELPLTQEFLAQMLGVHRPTVSDHARAFRQAGLIAYDRGKITVLDRAGLENTACECHAIIERTYRRLFPSTPGPGS